jgi:hypothetical protein
MPGIAFINVEKLYTMSHLCRKFFIHRLWNQLLAILECFLLKKISDFMEAFIWQKKWSRRSINGQTSWLPIGPAYGCRPAS